jgi:predicted HNH restriction endonuclease
MGHTNWWFPDTSDHKVNDFLSDFALRMSNRSTEANRSAFSDLSIEEQARYLLHKRIERNPKAAAAAKKHHGCKCQGCGLKFEEKYGEIGAGFIEVHHRRPLSTLKKGQTVKYNVAKDFAVLCSNCHRMIHRTADPSDLDGFRELLAQCRSERSLNSFLRGESSVWRVVPASSDPT